MPADPLAPGTAPAPTVIEAVVDALGASAAWLHLCADPPPDDAVTVDEMVADGGRRLDEFLAEWRHHHPGEPVEFRSEVVRTVAWTLLTPLLTTIVEARQRPVVDLASIPVRLAGSDDEIDRVWWPPDTRLEPVGDLDGTLTDLVVEAIDVLAPLVDTVRERCSVGRRGLWGRVVDAFTAIGPGYRHTDHRRRSSDLAAFRRAAAGTVLDQPLELVDIERPDGTRRMVRTVACCFAYTTDHCDSAERRPWHDGPFANYCMSCPLIPADETIARANYWLDCDEVEHGVVDGSASDALSHGVS